MQLHPLVGSTAAVQACMLACMFAPVNAHLSPPARRAATLIPFKGGSTCSSSLRSPIKSRPWLQDGTAPQPRGTPFRTSPSPSSSSSPTQAAGSSAGCCTSSKAPHPNLISRPCSRERSRLGRCRTRS